MEQGTRVWDPLVRIGHWSLVIAVAIAWLSTLGLDSELHEPAGYVAIAVALVRVWHGFRNSGHARFASFVRSPHAVLVYVRSLIAHRAPAYTGHNPLGGWMILTLLGVVAATSVTGWLFTTDRFWGVRWVSTLHEVLAWSLVGLVPLHIAGVLFASRRQRQNLIWTMVTGRKR